MPGTALPGFTANDMFYIGRDSFWPVSLAYFDRAPFRFSGRINKVHIKYLK